jgi:diguanylate cyclase (GGDEF)-like protein
MAHQQRDIDYAVLFASMPTPYVVLTPDLVVHDANPAYLEATGRRREELVGKYLFDAFPSNPDASHGGGASVRASLERARDSGRPDTLAVERYDLTVSGGFAERYWSIRSIPILGDDGSTVLLLHRVEDVTDLVGGREETQGSLGEEHWRRRMRLAEADLFARARELHELNRKLREAHDELAVRALHDPLTGLVVRSAFVEQLSRALSRLARRPNPVAVLFVDLDRLKHVNDTYGHGAGDELIRCCAARLRASVRPSDPVARFGGDEFVVLVDDLPDADEADRVAERVLHNLSAPCRLTAGPLVRPTASIGVAVGDSAAMGAETLISHADAAMYRAKQSGRGRYERYDEAAYTAASARVQLETELRAAVSTDQLRLHYQPIIDLGTGHVHAVEALLRWAHPRRGLVAAGDFVDVAEDSGLILDLGPWAIIQACRQLAEWDAILGRRTPERMFVNLSLPELAWPRLAEHVEGAAAEMGIAPRRVVLEITQTGMLEEPRAVSAAIHALHELGFGLAIDNFGAGYSSLGRVAQLPAGILKIDRSFVRDLHRDREATAIVSALLLLAHNLRKPWSP